jgi:flotillin
LGAKIALRPKCAYNKSAMLEPFLIVLAVLLLLAAALVFVFCIKKIRPGRAGIKTGFGGMKVAFDWMVRVPVLQTYHIVDISVKKLEITRKGKDGLVCRDNIRADITVAFYIRVDATEESVRKVSQMLTPERVSDMAQLRELFEAKFSEALKTVGKQLEFHELFTARLRFRDEIQNTIGKDLDGFLLQDVAIDYLEQTPLSEHDADNVLDSEGIKKITEITQRERVKANEFSQRAQVEVEKENADADIAKRVQQRRNEEDAAKQHRAVLEVKTNEEAGEQKVVALRRMEVEAKRLETEESIRLRTEDMNRAVQEREFTVTKERQRLEQESIQEGEEARVRRERLVSLAEMDKEVKVNEAAVDVQRKKAIVVAEEKLVAEQVEAKKTLEETLTAERAKEVALTDARKLAESEQVAKVVAADAQREAAKREAETMQILASAEAVAAEKRRQAMEQEAQGTAAREAAPGLAEARVIEAKAHAAKEEAEARKVLGMIEAEVTESQGQAEAEATKEKELAVAAGVEAKGLAEARAIEEKAKAMKLLHEAGQSHEEFRLRLQKEKEVELAAIEIRAAIASANASVVAEALKHAKIDIVGGENTFFEKLVRSVGAGKSLDALVENSDTLQGLQGALTDGRLGEQLGTLLQRTDSEAVKNLSLAAALTQLMNSTPDAPLRQAAAQVLDFLGQNPTPKKPSAS